MPFTASYTVYGAMHHLEQWHAWPAVRIELFVSTAFRILNQKADAMLAARAKTPQHKE